MSDVNGAAEAVAVANLVKRYPKRPTNAVDGVSFSVQRGEIFGLLGPNGAGKTTTVGILTTRVRLSSGVARVAGIDVSADPVRARRQLSVVPQRSNLDRSLNARQNLIFHAVYHGIGTKERNRRADALLEEFGLAERAKDKVDNYSGGMAQRLLIARALMHGPKVLFLDEPSTGLDPQARLFVWDRIRDLRASGVTIVLTTHDMDEAATLTDRVGIMDHGTLLALDTPGALTRSLPGRTTLDLTIHCAEQDTPDAVVEALSGMRGIERVERVAVGTSTPHDLRVRMYLTGEGSAMIAPVTEVLVARHSRLTAVSLGEPSLEDVFINLTGRDLR
ncbi:MAG: ABC transporter ATP-binding protein [Acidimicrobiales bacterium]